jgi:hypothetical protein
MPNINETTANVVFPRIEYTWDDRHSLLANKLSTKIEGGTFGYLKINVRMYYNVYFEALYHPINNRAEVIPWKEYYESSVPMVLSVSFYPAIEPEESTSIDLPPPIPQELNIESVDWYGRIYDEKKETPY